MTELLDVHPDDRVLEVGCRSGVAVQLIAAKLALRKVTGWIALRR
jgi:protein-L-isoaspartate O-methyltransferase